MFSVFDLFFRNEYMEWHHFTTQFSIKKKNHVMSANNVPASARKYYVLMPVIRQKLSELNVAKILFEWHIWNTYINKAFGDFVSIIFFFLLWVPLGFLLQLKFIQHQPINNTFAVILLLVKWHSLYFISHMAWLVIIIQFQLQNDSSNSYAIKKKISSEIDIVKFSIKCILECRNNDELIYFIQFLFWEFAKLLYLSLMCF